MIRESEPPYNSRMPEQGEQSIELDTLMLFIAAAMEQLEQKLLPGVMTAAFSVCFGDSVTVHIRDGDREWNVTKSWEDVTRARAGDALGRFIADELLDAHHNSINLD